MPMPWITDLADLVLGRACGLCQAPGPSLCPSCLDALRRRPPPEPVVIGHPPGDTVTVHYRLPYSGVGQRLLLDYKEHGDRSLRRPLGVLLADAIESCIADDASTAEMLVPVPGHARPRRGFPALPDLLRRAQLELASRGARTLVAPAVSMHRDHAPLKGRGRLERWRTVRHAFDVDPSAVRRLARARVIVVDDVVTTGATVLEAVRALRRAGLDVHDAAAVCHREAGAAARV